MTQVHTIQDNTGTASYNFLTGDLRVRDWVITPNGDGWTTETYTLVGRTTDANIITAVISIDEMAERTRLYWENQHASSTYAPWIYYYATDETDKRALLKSVELTLLPEMKFGPLLGEIGVFYSLVIIRSSVWEKSVSESVSDNIVSSLGGIVDLAALPGDYPGRIETVALQGIAGLTANLTTVWGGIRPDVTYTGDTDFNPVLELELGVMGGGAIGSDSDNASPVGTTDNVVTWTGTTGEDLICSVTVDQSTSSTDYDQWMGDYNILLRAKLSTADTVRLRLVQGYPSTTDGISGPYTYYSSTDYTMIEMGTFSVPPMPRKHSGVWVKNCQFRIHGIAITGAPVLTIDCLILVPSKHYFKATNLSLDTASAQTFNGDILEDGTVMALMSDSDNNQSISAQYAPINFTYPIEGGKLVLVAQEATLQDVGDSMALGLVYYNRYRTHGTS